MVRNFIADFEKRLLKFEGELRELVLLLFTKRGEATTYEVGKYLKGCSLEFKSICEYNHVKSWYRLRKTLENLEEEGLLRRKMSGKSLKNLRFLNYRWIKIVNKDES